MPSAINDTVSTNMANPGFAHPCLRNEKPSTLILAGKQPPSSVKALCPFPPKSKGSFLPPSNVLFGSLRLPTCLACKASASPGSESADRLQQARDLLDRYQRIFFAAEYALQTFLLSRSKRNNVKQKQLELDVAQARSLLAKQLLIVAQLENQRDVDIAELRASVSKAEWELAEAELSLAQAQKESGILLAGRIKKAETLRAAFEKQLFPSGEIQICSPPCSQLGQLGACRNFDACMFAIRTHDMHLCLYAYVPIYIEY